MFNITSFFDIHLFNIPKKTALVYPTTNLKISYAELQEYFSSFSDELRKQGLKKGDRIVVYLESSPEYLISYLAAWRMGGVVVPANIVWREEELLYALHDSGAVAIVCRGSSQLQEKIQTQYPEIILISPPEITEKIEEEISPTSHMNKSSPVSSTDVCQIQYTSGTTGQPKGAMLTQGGWMAALDAERDALDLRSDDVYLGIYPMAHVGISWGLSVLRAGGTWIIMDRFNLEEYIRLTKDYKATVLAGMPPVIHALAETPAGTEKSLESVRRIISGGGPMHSPTWRTFHDRFKIPIINAYGLSETIVLGAGTVIRPYHYPTADEFNSVGTPVGYSEVKIVNELDASEEVPNGTAGEIALRGPGVALGYWNKPKDTSEVFLSDGWFLTGDIGYIDKNGMLVITDRKKDMIIMSGWKIYPTEVENVLILHPDIKDIAVFGCPDDEKGEIPAAAVTLRNEENPLTLESLANYGRNHLAGYKIPRKLFIVEELPRVGGWKLLRKQLREKFCKV